MHFSFTEIRPCFASFLFVFAQFLQLLCKTVKEQASINNNKNWFIGNEKSLMELFFVKKDFVLARESFVWQMNGPLQFCTTLRQTLLQNHQKFILQTV